MKERRKRWRLCGPLSGATEERHSGPDRPVPVAAPPGQPPPFEDGLEKVMEKQGASYGLLSACPLTRKVPLPQGSGLGARPGTATASPSVPCSFPELPTCLWSELKPYRLSVLPPWPQE